MSHRADSNGSSQVPWRYWLDVTIDATALAGTADTDGTSDAQVVLPATLTHLWAVLNGSTDEILVTQADGVTELAYKLTDKLFTGAAAVADRNVGIQVQAVPIRYGTDGKGRLQRFRIYYGLSGYTQSLTAFTASSPLTGTIELGAAPQSARTIVVGPSPPGATLAPATLAKTSEESLYVWLDVSAFLAKRTRPYAKSLAYEEVLELLNDAETAGMREISGGTTTRTMVDVEKCSVTTLGRRTWIKVYVTGGTDGTDYALIIPFRTTLGQTLQARFRVQVRDVDDT